MKKLSNEEMKNIEGGRFCEMLTYKPNTLLPTKRICPRGYGKDSISTINYGETSHLWIVIWSHK